MILEVSGTSTNNKGAELMLVGIREHYAPDHADIRLAVEPWFGCFEDRAHYGLRTKLARTKFGRSALAMWLMPQSFRTAYGLVAEQDVHAVLDASGFAFGDQLGPERSERFARDVRRWKDAGKRVVLLPQALGPFDTPRVRRAFADVAEKADLVYARDQVSFQHLRGLGGTPEKLRLAPDFTNLVEGELPPGFEPQPRMACIVPNHRMLEKTSDGERAGYLPFLAACVQELLQIGLTPVIVLHDARIDESLVSPLQRLLGAPVPVIRERDPRCLKGILGCAHVVIGSRFHALVGALSQAVPSLGVGWSHKYEMLFADYDCANCVLSPLSTPVQIREAIRSVAEEPARSGLIGRLREAAAVQKRRTSEMWTEVDALLGVGVLSPATGGHGCARSIAEGSVAAQLNRSFPCR